MVDNKKKNHNLSEVDLRPNTFKKIDEEGIYNPGKLYQNYDLIFNMSNTIYVPMEYMDNILPTMHLPFGIYYVFLHVFFTVFIILHYFFDCTLAYFRRNYSTQRIRILNKTANTNKFSFNDTQFSGIIPMLTSTIQVNREDEGDTNVTQLLLTKRTKSKAKITRSINSITVYYDSSSNSDSEMSDEGKEGRLSDLVQGLVVLSGPLTWYIYMYF